MRLSVRQLFAAVCLMAAVMGRTIDVSAAERSLSLSATVPRDRDIEAKFQSAREFLAARNHASVVATLQQLLVSESTAFVLVGADVLEPSRERYQSVPNAVQSLLSELPAEALRLYEQQVGRPALSAMQAAIQRGDVPSVRRIVAHTLATEAEFIGLRYLAAAALDAGQFDAAMTAAQRALRHRRLEPLQKDRLLTLLARAQAGVTKRHGQDVRDLPADAGVGGWTVSDLLLSDDLNLFNEAQLELAQQSIPLRPRSQPVVRGDVLCVRTLRHLSAFHLESGRELWSTRRSMDETGAISSNQSLRELMARSIGRQSQLDSVLTTLTADDEVVVSVDVAQSRLAVLPPDMLRSRNSSGGVSTVIHARGLMDGQIRWSFSRDALASAGTEAVFEFLGVPQFFDDELWGLAQSESALVAYAISRQDGRLLRSSRVGETERGHAADSDWRLLGCSPTLWRGTLIYPTATGLLVGVDPLTGKPAWAVRYVRDDAPLDFLQLVGSQSGAGRRRWWDFWRQAQLLVSDRPTDPLVVVTPDRRDVSAIDESGALIWQRQIDDALFVAGIRKGRVLVLSRHQATVLDAATGQVAASVSISAPSGEGDWSHATAATYSYPSVHGVRTLDLDHFTPVTTPAALPSDATALPEQGRLVQTRRGSLLLKPESIELSRATSPQFETWNLTKPGIDTDFKLNELLGIARAAGRAGDDETALQTYLQLLNLNPTGLRRVHDFGPERQVRFDRLIAGDVLDLLTAARIQNLDREQRLQSLIAAARQAASQSPDPFAVQRFAERCGQLPGARDIWLSRQTRIGVGFAKSLLPLLALRDEAAFERTATVELSELFQARTYEEDARSMLSSLKGTQAQETLTPTKSHWPTGTPQVTEREMAPTQMAFKPLQVTAERGSLLSRLDVSWHAAGTTVRFIGDGRAGDWSLNLPATRSFLRRADVLAEGWGVGHLLILRLGTELFAITPLDENGEQRARLLWTVDLAPQAQFHAHRVIAARVGFADQDLHILDAFDRPIGLVGPVYASYLCYQAEGRLVCLETASGQMLWERAEQPFDSVVTGNESTVCVSTGRVTETLRSLDGATVARRVMDAETSGIHQARTVQICRVGSERFEGIDLQTGQQLWSREISAGDLPFAVDAGTWGLFSAAGEAEFLSLRTGQSEGRVTLKRPARVELFLCLSDDEQRYFLLSGPRTHATPETQFEAMLTRNALVDGTLTAVDRRTGAVAWSRDLSTTNWLLDQPHSVPFLMSLSSDGRSGTVLQLIEKRTGQELHRRPLTPREGWPLIRPNAGQPWISVRTATHELRIDYSE